jgi:hypothetical protein
MPPPAGCRKIGGPPGRSIGETALKLMIVSIFSPVSFLKGCEHLFAVLVKKFIVC